MARTPRRGRRCAGRRPVAWIAGLALAAGCAAPASPVRAEEAAWREQRERMVTQQIEARGIRDPRVLAALRKVPRQAFVPESERAHAYEDAPLPIGHGQTISQPFIVAAMSELAHVQPGARVLEVGTGSGYQAAVLGELAGEVYSIEILQPLADRARDALTRLGYANVHVRCGDGYAGWPEHAPFDAILVTAAPARVPRTLLEQLALGGRLVVPVGVDDQELQVHIRRSQDIEVRRIFRVRFVPMTGEPPPDE